MDFASFWSTLQGQLGHHLPRIVGALAVFALGWVIAVAARAAVLRLLALARLDTRIAESTGVTVQSERGLGVAVFWLVLLVTLIAVLNVLDLASVSAPIAAMMGDIVGYLPYALGGAVLTLVAWLVASLLRTLVVRALAATTIDDSLQRHAGMKPSGPAAGNVAFWLTLLLFLPSVLSAFRLTGTLAPVEQMLVMALGWLPNALGAAVIAGVGYLVARVLRGLVSNLLGAAGIDRIGERAGLDDAVKLSRLAGTLVFLFVLVPSLIAALDALKIEAISAPATAMLSQMLAAVPHILAAVVIVLLTWAVARFVAALIARLLENAGADALPARIGLEAVLSGPTRPSTLARGAIMFFAMLFAVAEAAGQLGFGQLRELTTAFIRFAGDILLGGVIFAVGFWLANLAYAAIDRASGAGTRGLAPVARVAILGIVLAMGLRAMGVANEIVVLAFGLALGAVAVAVALSFGLGGREAAGQLAGDWLRRWRERTSRGSD
ncbi:MAG: mechanosensitive ion channel [Burkholderiaceae bacterium]|nr:mechanosensitive ion channel [Burkholderiaceae bacterium]